MPIGCTPDILTDMHAVYGTRIYYVNIVILCEEYIKMCEKYMKDISRT